MTRTCLVAESDPFIAQLLGRFAEKSGLQVLHVQVGQEVLELGQQINPEVIILELELPGEIRGWDVVRALRGNDKTCGIPVITCSWRQDTEVFALVGEVHGMLHKPDLHFDDFAEVLKDAGIVLDRTTMR